MPSVSETFDAIIEQTHARKNGTGWKGLCPAHADRNPSLSIRGGDNGGIVLHCHAGCEQAAVVAALGIGMADLFPPRSESGSRNGRRIVATYDYRDASGALLYQAVRYDPKDFSQRRPDGRGGWLWNLHGTPLVPYRLPELIAADADAWVCVCEGEKDADRLAALGFVATTNAMGAGKWRAEYAPHFRGRRVAVIPDHDAAGGKHAQHVAQALSGTAADVRIVALPGLPDKGDVSDWLDAGGTADRLRGLIADGPAWDASPAPTPSRTSIITAAALSARVFPEPRWAVPGVVPEGATLLVGRPKQGKSWLLLGLGIAIAAGGRALGQIAVEPGDVLLLCLEDNERRLQDRLWRILDGEPAPERLHLVTEWPRLDEGGAAALDAWLTAHPETRMVGIDVLARMRPPSSGNGDLYARDYNLMAAIKSVADTHGAPLVAVHHSRKMGADDPLDTISGTSGLAGAADTALILTRERGAMAANLYVRGRDVPEADHALTFDEETCRWNLEPDAAVAAALRLPPNRAGIVALLTDRGALAPAAIADALKANRGTIRSTLHRMYMAGQVIERDGLYLPATGATGATDGVTTPILPVAPRTIPLQQVQQVESDGLLQVLRPDGEGATGKTRITTPTVAPVAGVAPDSVIAERVANLATLTPQEIGQWRQEVAALPVDDPEAVIDRMALAQFDAERKAS